MKRSHTMMSSIDNSIGENRKHYTPLCLASSLRHNLPYGYGYARFVKPKTLDKTYRR